jgi:hypothetical protein
MTPGYAIRHGQLECRYTSHGASSRLLARDSSSAAMCLVAPAPESRLGATRVLPRILWSQLPPPDIGRIRSRHMSRGSSSHILAQGSSGAATCPMMLYELWAIEVNKYPPVVLRSSSPIGTCAYLPRRHTTRPIPCACETCSGCHIKY